MSQPPRVAVFRNTYLPASETFVHEQMRRLSRWAPCLVTRERRHRDRFPTSWPVCEIGASGSAGRVAYTLLARSHRAEAFLREQRPALIHAHFAVDGVYALGFAERLGVPLVVTLHGHDVTRLPVTRTRHPAWLRHAIVVRRLQRRAAAFVAVSGALARTARERGYPRERLHVIPLGVDCERLRPQPVPAADPKTLRLLHVARLVEKKGTDVLLDALARLPASVAVELTVVGDGPLRARLERRARAQGLDAAFRGEVAPEAVRTALARADAFCLPSRQDRRGEGEGLPVSLLEAGACGLPLVATRHGGIPELVEHERTGLLVDEDDAAALARALARLAADPDLRRDLGAAARARVVERFDSRVQTARLEDLFDRIAAQASAARG